MSKGKAPTSHIPASRAAEDAMSTPSVALSIAGCAIETARDIQCNNHINNYNLVAEFQQRLLPDDKYFANSRDKDITFIENWVGTSLDPILWIRGAAATGKSTLLRRLLSIFRQRAQVGTFYFFPVGCNLDPLDVIKRMIQEMSIIHPSAVTEHKLLPSDTTLEEHVTYLIIRPLQLMFDKETSLIIIDAVDQYAHGHRLLVALSSIEYPNNIKVIFTGRPNEELVSWFNTSRATKRIGSFDLNGIDENIMSEYIAQRLSERHDWRSKDGLPTQANIDILVQKADGYIGWAAFAANLICLPEEAEPDEVLEDVVKLLPTLDALYRLILEPLRKRSERSQRILGMILVIEDVLSAEALDSLTYVQGLPAREVCHRLKILQTGNHLTPMARNFHSSFIEFLRDPRRCNPSYFPVSSEEAHLFVSRSCFKLLKPYYSTPQSPRSHASASILYASDFWPLHVANTTKTVSLTTAFPRDIRDEIMAFILACGAGWVSAQSRKWGSSDATPEGRGGLEQLRWLTSHASCERWGSKAATPLHVSRMIVALQTIVLRLAIDIIPDAWPPADMDLCILSSSLINLYQRTWSLSHLHQGINIFLESLKLCPVGHPYRDKCLVSLAHALSLRYERQGNVSDLDEATVYHREALGLRPPGHSERPTSLDNLGCLALLRYKRQGDISDLDEAIILQREALGIRSPGHRLRHYSLCNLANSLLARHEVHRVISDLDEAIQLSRELLYVRERGSQQQRHSAHQLGNDLETRNMGLGDASDSDETKTLQREPPNLHQGPSLRNVSNANEQQVKNTDFDERNTLFRESLNTSLQCHPEWDRYLCTLANALSAKYVEGGDLSDLDEAIMLYREALRYRPLGHPMRVSLLDSLAEVLWVRFAKRGSALDSHEAIVHHREAAKLYPQGHKDRAACLNWLAIGLGVRYILRGNESDLIEAIENYREAASLDRPSHPTREDVMHCLLIAISIGQAAYQLEGLIELMSLCQLDEIDAP